MEPGVATGGKSLKDLLGENPFGRYAQDATASQRISTARNLGCAYPATAELGAAGFVFLSGVLAPEDVEKTAAAMDRLHGETALGADSFSGMKSQRIFNILEPLPCCHALAMHPDVVAIVEAYLDDQIQLSSTASNSIHPGEVAHALHQDDT